MVYTLRFFLLKCSLFHNSNLFGSCIIHISYTECAKIKKNNSGPKRLTAVSKLCKHPPDLGSHSGFVMIHAVKDAALCRMLVYLTLRSTETAV